MSPRSAIYCLAVSETIVWAGLFYSFPALLLRWEAAFPWSKTALTGAFTASVAAAALFSPLAGRLIDAGRGHYVLSVSTLVGGIGMFSVAHIETYPAFVGLWVFIGIMMAGCLYEPCFILVTRTRGANAQRSITLITLFAGFASTLSFPLGHLVTEVAGWRTAASVYGALVILVGAPLMWLGSRALEHAHQTAESEAAKSRAGGEARGGPAHTTPRGRYGFLRDRAFWLLAAAFSLLALNHGVIINHILPLLEDRSLTPAAAVVAASFIGPMQVAGRVVMMMVERHVTSRFITTACFAALALASVLLIGAASAPLLVIGFVVLQGAGAGVQSIMKPIATRDILGAENFGIKSGCLALPVLVAFAFAPYFGSLIWSAGGYRLVLQVAFACAVAGLVCYLASSRRPA